jgi:hypothetical protein
MLEIVFNNSVLTIECIILLKMIGISETSIGAFQEVQLLILTKFLQNSTIKTGQWCALIATIMKDMVQIATLQGPYTWYYLA